MVKNGLGPGFPFAEKGRKGDITVEDGRHIFALQHIVRRAVEPIHIENDRIKSASVVTVRKSGVNLSAMDEYRFAFMHRVLMFSDLKQGSPSTTYKNSASSCQWQSTTILRATIPCNRDRWGK
jgi:hypothetical protein